MSVPKRRWFTLSDVAKGLRSLTFAESSPGDSADPLRASREQFKRPSEPVFRAEIPTASGLATVLSPLGGVPHTPLLRVGLFRIAKDVKRYYRQGHLRFLTFSHNRFSVYSSAHHSFTLLALKSVVKGLPCPSCVAPASRAGLSASFVEGLPSVPASPRRRGHFLVGALLAAPSFVAPDSFAGNVFCHFEDVGEPPPVRIRARLSARL